MAQSQANNESNNTPVYENVNIFDQMETLIAARNKIICKKQITSLSSNEGHLDLKLTNESSDKPFSTSHSQLDTNKEKIKKLQMDTLALKISSEIYLNDSNNDSNQKKEELKKISEMASYMRSKNEKAFQEIKNVQTEFDIAQINFKDLFYDNSIISNDFNEYKSLIEKTVMAEKGIEALFNYKNNSMNEYISKIKSNNLQDIKRGANNLEKLFFNKVYENGKQDFKNHEHLLAIMKRNNLVSTTNKSSVKLDPFTKQPILLPVINKICNHVYDQTSIDNIFKDNSHISCPYVECENKNFTQNDLMYAADLLKY